MKCPKCQNALAEMVKAGAQGMACAQCKGIWLEYDSEREVLKTKMEPFTLDELRRLRAKFEPLGRIEEIRYYPCPSCHQLMQRKNWGSHSGVVVDKCREHGTWYDEHELEKIMEYVALGGVELEKLRLVENGLTRLESRVETEALRLDKRIDHAYARARIFNRLGF